MVEQTPTHWSRTDWVAATVRRKIHTGEWRHGDVLPSTRDLATQWGLSRGTVHAALQRLVEEGLIVNRSRSRRFVYAPRQGSAGPYVVLIGGYPGSGKTALGQALSRETGWTWLDQDMLRAVVECALETGGQVPHDRTSPTYAQLRACEIESLLHTAEQNAGEGRSVIVAATFLPGFGDREWLTGTMARFHRVGARVLVVWVACDADTMRTNLRRRGAARDMHKLDDWVSYVSSIDLGFRPAGDHRVVDGSESARPLQWQVRELVQTVRDC